MKIHWQSVSKQNDLKKKQKKRKLILIGLLILVAVMLLSSCSQTKVVYVEAERQPITCIDSIKTPLDMAKCLAEYKQRY